jgi:hypothetical protein
MELVKLPQILKSIFKQMPIWFQQLVKYQEYKYKIPSQSPQTLSLSVAQHGF